MKVFIKLFLALLLVTPVILSQGVYQQWVSRYNGSANAFDGATSLTTDDAGNVYVGGSSYQAGTSRDMLTIKLTSSGDTSWVRKYNGAVNGGDYVFDIFVDNQGNVYVTGRSDNGGTTLSDFTTIKYNSIGQQQWVALYNGTANGIDEGYSVRADDIGNVYVTGKSPGVGTDLDIVTIKYDPTGVEQWVQRFNGTSNMYDYPFSLALTAGGDVVVAGMSINAGTGSDFTVIKYNTEGTLQWFKNYNNPAVNGGDFARSVVVDGTGNVIVTGYVDNGPVTRYDFTTVKYNSSGVEQWVASYNGSTNTDELAYDLTVDLNGNVYVTGGGLTTTADSNFITVKYNPSGLLLWVTTYNGPANLNDVARSISVDELGDVYVTGGSQGATMDDYATIKYTTTGVMKWVMRYNGPANSNDYTNSIAVSSAGGVYVTGRSMGVGTDYDFATIKYSLLVGVEPVSNEVPQTFSLNQNYPNPFNPETIISFDIPKDENVILNVYDINGRLVSNPINSRMHAGKYNYSFNASNLNSGVYFYTISAGSFTDSKKMMVIK